VRKFALSSSAYTRFKLAQAIRHIALAGYSGIEVVADVPHGYPPALGEADRRGIRHALAQSRLAIANVNASPMTAIRDELRPSWIEPDRVLRDERVQHTLDAGQLARDIGGPTITTPGGGTLEHEKARQSAARQFRSGLKQVVAAIEKGKCPPVLIDPGPGLLIETAAQALDIVDGFKPPQVAVSFNTAHFHRAGQDIGPAIRQLKDVIRHVHIEDLSADGSEDMVVPGTGLVDFAEVFDALDAIRYQGWLTVDLSGTDVHPDDAAKQALQYLGQFDR